MRRTYSAVSGPASCSHQREKKTHVFHFRVWVGVGEERCRTHQTPSCLLSPTELPNNLADRLRVFMAPIFDIQRHQQPRTLPPYGHSSRKGSTTRPGGTRAAPSTPCCAAFFTFTACRLHVGRKTMKTHAGGHLTQHFAPRIRDELISRRSVLIPSPP